MIDDFRSVKGTVAMTGKSETDHASCTSRNAYASKMLDNLNGYIDYETKRCHWLFHCSPLASEEP